MAEQQRLAFLSITAAWTPSDREAFARLVARYSHDAAAWTPETTPVGTTG